MSISISNIQTISSWGERQPSKNLSHKGLQLSLIVLSVASAALTLVPSIKYACSLALRSISFFSSSVICAEKFANGSFQEKIINCVKVAIVALGIVALAASMPILLTASLATDVAIQAIECVKSLYKQEAKQALIHFGILVVDALALAAITIATPKMIIIAAIVSAIVLLGIAISIGMKANNKADIVETLSYLSLAVLGVTTTLK